MKTKFLEWFRTCRRVLTEVPGWPDAPVSVQLRRAMPVLLPCAALVLLLDWHLMIQAPRVRDQRRALEPLLALEAEVGALRMSCSDQRLAEAAQRARAASELLLSAPAALPDFLLQLKNQAAGKNWDAQFIVGDHGGSEPVEGARVGYLPVRAKLVPQAGNPDVFGSFMEVVEGFSNTGKRIDLIRLSVRADEQRWQLVEMNLRLGYSFPK